MGTSFRPTYVMMVVIATCLVAMETKVCLSRHIRRSTKQLQLFRIRKESSMLRRHISPNIAYGPQPDLQNCHPPSNRPENARKEHLDQQFILMSELLSARSLNTTGWRIRHKHLVRDRSLQLILSLNSYVRKPDFSTVSNGV
uniref:uncharacterized protein LOC113474310 n=1 Tax=Ciona intestinalis TaxID=7719 RepID=UPI000EF554A2|nr:uncharacterized protein LOC113474310 [Ciona intestinalis]|eukprot:XP_026690652.1 uncharacterized protein LOC113474310 [Ciona intestinalis]